MITCATLTSFLKKSSLAPQELRYTHPFISDAKWGPFSDTAKGERVCACVRNNTHFDGSQRHSPFSCFFFSEKWYLMCNINLFFLKKKKQRKQNWIITLLYLIKTLFVSKISFPRFLTNPSFFPISHVSVLICFFFYFLVLQNNSLRTMTASIQMIYSGLICLLSIKSEY